MVRRVVLKPRAERDISDLPIETATRVCNALRRLAEANLGDVKKLQGVDPPEYRLRIGDYRVRFQLTADAIEVLRVLPRGGVYRD
ncbi:MAG: type II toxin-antitoxin system RelE/ParE family toxin [Myxococcales bacterium]